MSPWHGKWALVTGASAGIGREIARQLAEDGANVILTARRADRLAELAAELRSRYQVQAEICVADFTHPQAPQEILRFTQEKELPIEVLINNAGFGDQWRVSSSGPAASARYGPGECGFA